MKCKKVASAIVTRLKAILVWNLLRKPKEAGIQ